MNQEILLKLNANGVNFDHIAGGGPSIIDREAVIWALSGSSAAQFSLALLMVVGDESERSSVWAGLFMAGMALPEYLTFKIKNNGCMDALCHLVIEEFVSSPICKHCNGTGLNADYVECKPCGGSGNKFMSIRARMKVINKNHRCWYQFEAMHEALLNILRGWDASNKRKLTARLR